MNNYEIPAIGLSEAASENPCKYGRMRKQYLRAHRPGLMNICKAQVEEVILSELIWD